MAKITSMNREQLNAEAARLGVADAETLERNADVIAAIEANETYQAEQATQQDTAERQEPVTGRLDETVAGGRYEVNGTLVDANGKPVKG